MDARGGRAHLAREDLPESWDNRVRKDIQGDRPDPRERWVDLAHKATRATKAPMGHRAPRDYPARRGPRASRDYKAYQARRAPRGCKAYLVMQDPRDHKVIPAPLARVVVPRERRDYRDYKAYMEYKAREVPQER